MPEVRFEMAPQPVLSGGKWEWQGKPRDQAVCPVECLESRIERVGSVWLWVVQIGGR